MYKITKEFHFSASHEVLELHAEHPCTRLHGHNYIIKVELKSKVLNSSSMVQDYGELSDIKEWIDNTFDHRHLNDILPFNPTAEKMARFFFEKIAIKHPLVSAVSVSETPKTWATYES